MCFSDLLASVEIVREIDPQQRSEMNNS